MFVGIFLVVIGLLNIIFHIIYNRSFFLIWYCNHIALVAGILILLKNRYWLNAIINVGMFPILIWIADYLGYFINGKTLFGASDYVFEETNRAMFWLFHQHLFVVPFMILALWLLGGAVKNSWSGSVLYGLFLFLISLPTDPAYNANCAHKSCILLPEGIAFLIIQQIAFVFFFFVSNWLLIKFLNRK